MASWKDLEAKLNAHLNLDRAPVGVTFCDTPPAGVRKFMGSVPSGCSFWRVAAEAPPGKGSFYTEAADHQNCPIGAYTHNIDQLDGGKNLNDMLGMMAQVGYVKMEEVPQIPRWPKTPAAVVYARLGEAKVAPDVVIFAVHPTAAMLLGEAARSAGVASNLPPLPRPTCMAIPAAASAGATMSLGCIGNRIYTGAGDDHIYMMVRGADLEKVTAALETIKNANDQLAAFHNERKPGLTRAES
ncbi:MAG TPA: DUF169 domain-containing protein [Myxococcota bacterium]|jgi:uncharacterized protein (DUF169 family)|nr:DUF169 domain-containing protein [Myxococcota bacterium]